mgnify:CR=1 FL=1
MATISFETSYGSASNGWAIKLSGNINTNAERHVTSLTNLKMTVSCGNNYFEQYRVVANVVINGNVKTVLNGEYLSCGQNVKTKDVFTNRSISKLDYSGSPITIGGQLKFYKTFDRGWKDKTLSCSTQLTINSNTTKTYTITYSGTNIPPQIKKAGSTVYITSIKPTSSFSHWQTNSGTVYYSGQDYKTDADLTLTAVNGTINLSNVMAFRISEENITTDENGNNIVLTQTPSAGGNSIYISAKITDSSGKNDLYYKIDSSDWKPANKSINGNGTITNILSNQTSGNVIYIKVIRGASKSSSVYTFDIKKASNIPVEFDPGNNSVNFNWTVNFAHGAWKKLDITQGSATYFDGDRWINASKYCENFLGHKAFYIDVRFGPKHPYVVNGPAPTFQEETTYIVGTITDSTLKEWIKRTRALSLYCSSDEGIPMAAINNNGEIIMHQTSPKTNPTYFYITGFIIW